MSCGIEEQRAYKHFDAWAAADTYFPADDELAAMREATFQADCIWQDPPHTLLVGRKPGFPIWLWYLTARTSRRAVISGVPTQGTHHGG